MGLPLLVGFPRGSPCWATAAGAACWTRWTIAGLLLQQGSSWVLRGRICYSIRTEPQFHSPGRVLEKVDLEVAFEGGGPGESIPDVGVSQGGRARAQSRERTEPFPSSLVGNSPSPQASNQPPGHVCGGLLPPVGLIQNVSYFFLSHNKNRNSTHVMQVPKSVSDYCLEHYLYSNLQRNHHRQGTSILGCEPFGALEETDRGTSAPQLNWTQWREKNSIA